MQIDCTTIKLDVVFDFDQHPFLGGNKFYKLAHLNKDIHCFDAVISYGGSQSNMLAVLAYYCFLHRKPFFYFTSPLSSTIQNSPFGNYALALRYRVKIHPCSGHLETLAGVFCEQQSKGLLVHQGGFDECQYDAFRVLAKRIELHYLGEHKGLVVPSGTGVCAFWLAHFLRGICPVYTYPCVADEQYLRRQFAAYAKALKISCPLIEVLQTSKKNHFGKCHEKFFELYLSMLKKGVQFEMLYDIPTINALLNSSHEGNFLYWHGGGLRGNESMLKRYFQKAPL